MPLQTKRHYLDEFAKQQQFDALVATNWYSVTPKDLLATKVDFIS